MVVGTKEEEVRVRGELAAAMIGGENRLAAGGWSLLLGRDGVTIVGGSVEDMASVATPTSIPPSPSPQVLVGVFGLDGTSNGTSASSLVEECGSCEGGGEG